MPCLVKECTCQLVLFLLFPDNKTASIQEKDTAMTGIKKGILYECLF